MSRPKVGDVVASPDDVLGIALSLARAGWYVFPVLVKVQDDEGRTDKQPLTPFTSEGGSSIDPEQIATWWGQWRNAWPGIYMRGSGLLVVDVDVPKGTDERDGRANLAAAGLDLPKSLRVKTLSGGRHHYFATPTPYPDDLTITKNDPVAGVDLRAGNGYTVWWGDALVGRPVLDRAPDWAIEAATRDPGAYARGGGDVDTLYARMLPGKPSKRLRAVLDDVTDEGMSHDDMLATVTQLVKYAADRGARTAYDEARETYTANYPGYARAWDEATKGSVGALGVPPLRIPLTKPERKALAKKQAGSVGKPDTDPDAQAVVRPAPTTAANHPSAGFRDLNDGPLAEEVTERLRERWAYGRTTGLIRYRDHVWHPSDVDVFTEHVRLALRDVLEVELRYASKRGDDKRVAMVAGLASRRRQSAVAAVARGILANDPVETDAHPDLLNVANGVVHLATGALTEHDPLLYFTKKAPVGYDPKAVDPVWNRALESLPPKVAAWLQVRMGQACTGHTPDDAKMPLLEGSGQNAKSTLLDAIRKALGEYAVTVSDRLLLANPGDHPTELTDLMGARLAVIEELPEGRNLNVKRLKDVLGTATLTARRIRADNVSWAATHSIVLSTNYRPIVAETDHGTWRRLALVTFPYRYLDESRELVARNDRRADPSVQQHLNAAPNAAVLAWLVQGARTWYGNGKKMPPPPKRVAADTHDWRLDADPVLSYVGHRLELAPGHAIPAGDLVVDYNAYLESRSQRPWSEQTIAQRFADHVALPDVVKREVSYDEVTPSRSVKALGRVGRKGQAWVGVRFVLDDPVVPVSPEVATYAAGQV